MRVDLNAALTTCVAASPSQAQQLTEPPWVRDRREGHRSGSLQGVFQIASRIRCCSEAPEVAGSDAMDPEAKKPQSIDSQGLFGWLGTSRHVATSLGRERSKTCVRFRLISYAFRIGSGTTSRHDDSIIAPNRAVHRDQIKRNFIELRPRCLAFHRLTTSPSVLRRVRGS
jgi:hypothetical protein